MSIETIFNTILMYKLYISIAMIALPWIALLLCIIIPGRREESFLLSANMSLALICLIIWVGYLVYTVNVFGWAKVVKEADIILLILPPYYITASIILSRKRMPLDNIPAYQTLQGLALIVGIFLILSWIGNKIRIIFFSFFPLHFFLILLGILLLIGYIGFRKMINK